MSEYYNSQRIKNLYEPGFGDPFKLSRSKIDLFLECPRCFYLDRRLGVGRPPGFPFALNSAVDALLKQEFDIHRAAGTRHPLMEKYGIDAVPFAHEELDRWRHNFTGVQCLHQSTNFLVFGALDDLWAKTLPQPSPSKGEGDAISFKSSSLDKLGTDFCKEEGGAVSRQTPPPPSHGKEDEGGLQRKGATELIVVDYKATAKEEEITELDKEWHRGYKRQMEIYQWLLRQNGYRVSDTGYFVYCNGRADRKAFDGKLEFDVTLIPYKGNDSWVEKILLEIKKCLDTDELPAAGENCDYCAYFESRKSKE